MNIQLNYHHLRYFLAVATEGGITQAAHALHVSAPTLSTQVQALEEFLETRLFLREGRSMVLTEAGRVVKGYAERVFALGDEMVEVMHRRGTDVGEGGTVFVGILDSVPKLLASSILSRSWEAMPRMRVVVREGLPGELFPALAAHQLDIVISTEPAASTFRTVLFSKRTGRFSVHLVAAPALRKKFSRKTGLNGFPVLVPTRESAMRRELDRWWAEQGIRPDIRAELDDSAALYELASAGLGAAPVLAPVLPSVTERYGLSELPLRTGLHEELYVLTAERQITHPGTQIIARMMEKF